MENTTHPLLRPRYQLLIRYPECPFKTDEIIELTEYNRSMVPEDNGAFIWETKVYEGHDVKFSIRYTKQYFQQFPKIFRALHWSEYRKPEEMPRFVKVNSAQMNSMIEVSQHFVTELPNGQLTGSVLHFISTTHPVPQPYFAYIPATQEEIFRWQKSNNEFDPNLDRIMREQIKDQSHE